MHNTAKQLLQIQENEHLATFVSRLASWIMAEQNQETEETPALTAARARALLRAAGVVDDGTLSDFARLMESPAAQRLALFDLLEEAALAEDDATAVKALAVRSQTAAASTVDADAGQEDPLLALAMAVFARQRGYPLQQLDPASPPARHSPAGQILARTGQFLRKQVLRSATERDRLAQQLAYRPEQRTFTLAEMQAEEVIAPLPPHFRPPVPVRYPEVARETIRVCEEELGTGEQRAQPVTRSEPLVITEEDLPPEEDEPAQVETPPREQRPPTRMPPISISREQTAPPVPPSPLPATGVVMPSSTTESRAGLTVALRQMFRSEELRTTKLRVIVQAYPDGPGLYGLQVRVTCKGIKSYVAGTTNRDGHFLAELPVRLRQGLTYDVDVTWPRDMGGDTERKSITLHADRTEFKLPFYQRLNADSR